MNEFPSDEQTREKYEALKALGKGAFGIVSLARNKETKSLCVVKRIHLEDDSPGEIEAIHAEVKLLSTLKHPNIVGYQEVYVDPTDRNCICIVMDFCDGGDLDKRMKHAVEFNYRFQENQIMSWFTQLVMALEYLHKRTIIHRDLKGQNVFLMKNGMVKLGDFGVSKIMGSASLAKTMVGTPHYLSPEIIKGDGYDFKTDIWSLGCILYELCTLNRPFDGDNMFHLMANIQKGEYKAIGETLYSADLRGLSCRLLELNPSDRPSASQILADPWVRDHVTRVAEELSTSDPQNTGVPTESKTNQMLMARRPMLKRTKTNLACRLEPSPPNPAGGIGGFAGLAAPGGLLSYIQPQPQPQPETKSAAQSGPLLMAHPQAQPVKQTTIRQSPDTDSSHTVPPNTGSSVESRDKLGKLNDFNLPHPPPPPPATFKRKSSSKRVVGFAQGSKDAPPQATIKATSPPSTTPLDVKVDAPSRTPIPDMQINIQTTLTSTQLTDAAPSTDKKEADSHTQQNQPDQQHQQQHQHQHQHQIPMLQTTESTLNERKVSKIEPNLLSEINPARIISGPSSRRSSLPRPQEPPAMICSIYHEMHWRKSSRSLMLEQEDENNVIEHQEQDLHQFLAIVKNDFQEFFEAADENGKADQSQQQQQQQQKQQKLSSRPSSLSPSPALNAVSKPTNLNTASLLPKSGSNHSSIPKSISSEGIHGKPHHELEPIRHSHNLLTPSVDYPSTSSSLAPSPNMNQITLLAPALLDIPSPSHHQVHLKPLPVGSISRSITPRDAERSKRSSRDIIADGVDRLDPMLLNPVSDRMPHSGRNAPLAPINHQEVHTNALHPHYQPQQTDTRATDNSHARQKAQSQLPSLPSNLRHSYSPMDPFVDNSRSVPFVHGFSPESLTQEISSSVITRGPAYDRVPSLHPSPSIATPNSLTMSSPVPSENPIMRSSSNQKVKAGPLRSSGQRDGLPPLSDHSFARITSILRDDSNYDPLNQSDDVLYEDNGRSRSTVCESYEDRSYLLNTRSASTDNGLPIKRMTPMRVSRRSLTGSPSYEEPIPRSTSPFVSGVLNDEISSRSYRMPPKLVHQSSSNSSASSLFGNTSPIVTRTEAAGSKTRQAPRDLSSNSNAHSITGSNYNVFATPQKPNQRTKLQPLASFENKT